jgi:hypothetical protein
MADGRQACCTRQVGVGPSARSATWQVSSLISFSCLLPHPTPRSSSSLPPSPPPGPAKLAGDFSALRKAWESSARVTKEDWAEWMRHFSVELLGQSPSPALRACHALAQVGVGAGKGVGCLIAARMESNPLSPGHLLNGQATAKYMASCPCI